MVRLGQRLHQKRLQRKQTLEEIAQELKIKASFLAAIERGDYHKLPSPAYAQGFVRNYATYLGLSKAETTVLFKREFDEKKAMKILPDSLIKTKEFPLHRLKIQQSIILFALILLVVFSYLLFQYRAAFFPPQLTITTPLAGSKTAQNVTVKGNTDSSATVMINGQTVPVSNSGYFQKTVTLFPGNATISIKAENNFGKTTTVERTVDVQ